jgi:hypothetical protein
MSSDFDDGVPSPRDHYTFMPHFMALASNQPEVLESTPAGGPFLFHPKPTRPSLAAGDFILLFWASDKSGPSPTPRVKSPQSLERAKLSYLKAQEIQV